MTVFGSARVKENTSFYTMGIEAGRAIAQKNWITLTGGGPGMMEAANRGAFEAGGHSLGCNISLPFEQRPNPYLHRVFTCDYFFTRKFLLIAFSDAYLFLPGGLGTLDELFEVVTLMQTKKIPRRPVVLVDRSFWLPLLSWVEGPLQSHQFLGSESVGLFKVCDSLEESILEMSSGLSANLEHKKEVPLH